MSVWNSGDGDMVMRPDLSTLRRAPWLPGTALVLADSMKHDGSPIEPSPRQVLRRQLDRLKQRGLRPLSPLNWNSWSSMTPTARPGRADIAS